MEAKEKRKTTSITLPLDWWETLKQLATLREVQSDAEAVSFNSVMLWVMEGRMGDAKVELAERKRRKPR